MMISTNILVVEEGYSAVYRFFADRYLKFGTLLKGLEVILTTPNRTILAV